MKILFLLLLFPLAIMAGEPASDDFFRDLQRDRMLEQSNEQAQRRIDEIRRQEEQEQTNRRLDELERHQQMEREQRQWDQWNKDDGRFFK